MKKLLLSLMCLIYLLGFTTIAVCDVKVKGYYKKDGTYVQPHYRSNPDGNTSNNWSTMGNINPHTLEPGTTIPKDPEYKYKKK